MLDLTSNERGVLKAIRQFRQTHGYSASYRDICRLMNWAAVNSARQAIYKLESKGYLLRQPGISRSLRLTRKGIQGTREVKG